MSIELERLVKRFKDFTAVNDISIEIKDGEFFVLLGPSGCGKTTTLRMIAGLEQPTEGRIVINGREVTHLPPRARDIAMAFQDYGLYPHMTAFDNIAFPLKIRKTPKPEIKEKVESVAERMSILHLLGKRPAQLSGGERQRVSLARALVRNPGVFLMDEPLSNLDAKLRAVMRTEIKQLVTSLGITTVYVTHDQIEAMAMADRIAIMNKGNMEQIGAPLDVYENPSTKFVAQFIGAPPMNLFDAHISPDGQLTVDQAYLNSLVHPDLVSPEEVAKWKSQGRKPVLGVRPENIRLVEGGGPEVARCRIELIEPLGQDTYVYLRLGEVRLIAVAKRVTARVGDEIGLSIDQSDVRLIAASD